MTLSWLISLALFGIQAAKAEIRSEWVEYRDGDTMLEGFLAFDAKRAAKRPGVLVLPDWMGMSDFAQDRARELAKLGYTAFVADIYGKGVRPADAKEAGTLATRYKTDRALYRRRAALALDQLRKHKTVNGKTAAIGYCFGGTGSLELGRSGADLLGIVSFHGGLDTPNPADGRNIRAKVLVLHGADDPFVPADQVKAFEDEMRTANVDWQLVKYANAVHAFTNPKAGKDNSAGAAYNAEADRRSWIAMQDFFREIFH